MELGKDRVGEGMQLLRPELPIAFNALLGVQLVIFGAWEAHNQLNLLEDDFYGDPIYGHKRRTLPVVM